mmetsp:Transcript_1072/g.2432  ORF Transcript_1072/g.2432 Transcript_1072/m.2432 type:complete len:203 (-) Transcript_1072:1484-2092(-)
MEVQSPRVRNKTCFEIIRPTRASRLRSLVPNSVPVSGWWMLLVKFTAFLHQQRRSILHRSLGFRQLGVLLEKLGRLLEALAAVAQESFSIDFGHLLRPLRLCGFRRAEDVVHHGGLHVVAPQVDEVDWPGHKGVLHQAGEGVLRDQVVRAIRLVELLQLGGDVGVLARGAILYSRVKAHVADKHLTRVHAAANVDLRKVPVL